MELLRIRSGGRPAQMQTVPGSAEFERGVLGAALSPKEIDGHQHTVVQLLLDAGLESGSLGEQEHRGLRTTIEQRHPG